MAQLRQSMLLILSIVAIALAAVLVVLAPHNRALAQPSHGPVPVLLLQDIPPDTPS